MFDLTNTVENRFDAQIKINQQVIDRLIELQEKVVRLEIQLYKIQTRITHGQENHEEKRT